MNEHEELLSRAAACLSEASKIEDPVVRAKVVDLAYRSRKVAQAAILRAFDEAWSNRPSAEDTPLAATILGPSSVRRHR